MLSSDRLIDFVMNLSFQQSCVSVLKLDWLHDRRTNQSAATDDVSVWERACLHDMQHKQGCCYEFWALCLRFAMGPPQNHILLVSVFGYAKYHDNEHAWCCYRMAERVKATHWMKAHIHSLTANGAEQQKCSRYSGNPVSKTAVLLSVSERYLNDSDFCIGYGVHHSAKYLNI